LILRNNGDAALADVTVSVSALTGLTGPGCTMTFPATLPVGASYTNSCTVNLICPGAQQDVTFAATANVDSRFGPCGYDIRGSNISVRTDCHSPVVCVPQPGIDVMKTVACLLPGDVCGTFGDIATGVRGDSTIPAFCYRITITNKLSATLTNVTVFDDKLGNLTSFYFASPSIPFTPGQSITRFFRKDWDVNTTNTVTVSGKSVVSGATVTASDKAITLVEQARITCTVTAYSPDERDGNTNDNVLKLPEDGLAHPVTLTVMVMNIGQADLANVTISAPTVGLFGCAGLPAPFPLGVGMAAKVIICQGTATCPISVTNIVTISAEVSTNGGACAYTTNGAPVRVGASCDTRIMCEAVELGGCRVTGGGRQDTTWPLVQYMTHGGQVGAPVGTATSFDPDSECIHGNWEDVRHEQGGNRGNFHAKSFDSLMCACLACAQDPGSGFVIGGLCNPGARTCGPEPRRAPANKICFSGVGDYTETKGSREPRSVLFRVDVEDRSEPGNSSAGGGTPPPDRHRIRIWILTAAELARLNNPNDRLLDFRRAIACTPGSTALEDGAVGANGRAVPLGTPVFGVRRPDIDDGGEMTHGNHQIHPSIKDCP
jgi:hypothetical protein